MLKFNESNGAFLLYTNETEAAEAAGLTLSTTIRGSNGEKVYFTADHNKKPVFNPYAVLEFYNDADEASRSRLHNLVRDYNASWSDNSDQQFPSPDGKEYLPYQRAGIAYALDRTNCIIGDEPGLGKTIQAIGVANAIGAKRVLVLCPASIRRNWRREVYDWSTISNLKTHPIFTGKDGFNKAADYTICSYGLASRNKEVFEGLMSQDWDLMITDEGHYLKTPDALRTRAVFGGGHHNTDPDLPFNHFHERWLAQKADKIVSLTGTPLPNRPREAYTQCRGLDWGAIDFLSQEAFMYRYNPSVQYGTHTHEEKGRLPELNARLRTNLMVRRHKKDVLTQLPDKRYEMTYIDPDGAIAKVLAKEALIDFDPYDMYNENFTLEGTPISTLRREMGEAMVPRIVDYMKYILDIVETPKAILYAHHKSVIDALTVALEHYGVVLHRGGMSDEAKDGSVQEFVHGKPRIFLGQLNTMDGVDGLQHVTSTVVLGEPAWNPGINEQCVDRAHRIHQHDNVVAHFLLVEGSFNEKVLNVVLDKAVDIHASIDRRLVV